MTHREPDSAADIDPVRTRLDAERPDGCRPFEFRPSPEGPPRFVSGDTSGTRVRTRYFLRASDGWLVGNVWFGPGAQGPPGYAHGGASAALMDETMGSICWAHGFPVLAANVTVDFKAPVPLERFLRVDSRIDRRDGRKLFTSGRIYDDDGRDYTVATGLFLDVSDRHVSPDGTFAEPQVVFLDDE